MEDIYDNFGRNKYHLNLIQYYALYDPNGEEGLIQGLRYYPRNTSTVIPNNPKLNCSINYYKPYTNPKVVLPKPRYAKKLSSLDQKRANSNKNTMNTINQQNYNNAQNLENPNMNYNDNNNFNMDGENTINKNGDIYRTFRRSYSNEKEIVNNN